MVDAPLDPPYRRQVGRDFVPDQRLAYRHLLKADKYDPWSERGEGERVVVIFPLCVRLFRTLEDVGRVYSWSVYKHNVFISPEHLNLKKTSAELRELYDRLSGCPAPSDISSQELAKYTWDLCQKHGDKVNGIKHVNQATGEVGKFLVNLDKAKETREQGIKVTKQLGVIIDGLIENETSSYSPDGLKKFANGLLNSGRLKTKQDPLLVVKYYVGELRKLGIMSGGERRRRTE